MKTQFGDLLTGDLKENTLTIEVDGDVELQAGKYAVVPIDEYNNLIKVEIKGGGETKSSPPPLLNESKFKKGEWWKYKTPDGSTQYVLLYELRQGSWHFYRLVGGKFQKSSMLMGRMFNWEEMTAEEIQLVKMLPSLREILMNIVFSSPTALDKH